MTSKDDDFLWLLNTLKKAARDFETLYGAGFQINDTIIIKQGEPKHWFYMDSQGHIRQKNEEWLKYQVIKEYFKNPQIKQEDLNEIENSNEIQYSGFVPAAPLPPDQLLKSRTDSFLFYFYQKVREESIVRPATISAAEQLMSKPQDFQEILNHWTKIVGYYPINNYKGSVLYQVSYNGKNKKSVIERSNIETQRLDPAEFVKKEGQQKKTYHFKAKLYKSLASTVNEKCNHFISSLVRFIETKYHKTIGEMCVEFFMSDSGQIFLSGAEKVIFVGSDGQPDPAIDKNALEKYVIPQMEAFKCQGQYCHCAGDTTYYDETDEAFSLFVMPQQKGTEFYVQNKSILMDKIERNKTIQAIKNVQKNVRVTEQLLFKVRKFYSFSKISSSAQFRHYKFDNIYRRIRVCEYCYAMYSKLDSLRAENLGQKKQKQMTEAEIAAVIDKMTNSTGLISKIVGGTLFKEKNISSPIFYEKLMQFDNEQEEFQKNYTVTKTVDPGYFTTKSRSKLGQTANFFSMTQSNSNPGDTHKEFVLPKIVEVSLKEKNTLFETRKKQYVSKQEAEALGLKHYLGHTKNLPFSDCGLAISKSSLALNQLQDKIREVENLKAKMENEKIKKVVEEIELIMCPYYGKNKVDTTRFAEFIQTLKEREPLYAIEENPQDKSTVVGSRRVQVVTDKNEFLTENQRKQKQDKEKKAREIEENKKNFLEENRELAASVLKYRQQQRKQKQLDRKKKESSSSQKQFGLLGESEGKSVTNGDYDEYEEEFDHFSSSHNLSPKKVPSISSLKAPNEDLDSRPSSAKNELQFPEELHKREESKKNSNINDNPEKYKPKDFSMLSNDN